MKNRFWLFKRRGIFYIQDAQTRRKQSLRTRNRREALHLRAIHNDAAQASFLDMAFAKAYLSTRDPDFPKRTWQNVMDCFCARGKPETQAHRKRIANHRLFNLIRPKNILETTPDDFRFILESGGVMVNSYLRCLQGLALGLNWLPWPILPNKLCPVVHSKPKRAVTAVEHQQIVSTETNVERRLYYELLWEIGAS